MRLRMDYLDYDHAQHDARVLRKFAVPCRIHGESGQWWISITPPWYESMSDHDARIEAAAGWDDKDKAASDEFNRRRRAVD